ATSAARAKRRGSGSAGSSLAGAAGSSSGLLRFSFAEITSEPEVEERVVRVSDEHGARREQKNQIECRVRGGQRLPARPAAREGGAGPLARPRGQGSAHHEGEREPERVRRQRRRELDAAQRRVGDEKEHGPELGEPARV